MISWITIVILSTPRPSTKARAPWFSAIIRFWIKVESLNRPPTLLTISSSFSSSIMIDSTSTVVLNQDCRQLVNRPLQVVVDQMYVVTLGQLELPPGVGQPPLDRCLVIGAPGPQPLLEHLQTGRPHEDQEGARHFLTHLNPPLHVDHQDHAGSLRQCLAHRLGRCSVAMAMHLGRLEKLVTDVLELLGRQKDIVAARKFAGARRTRGGGDRNFPAQAGPLEQALDQRALARARWTGKDDEPAGEICPVNLLHTRPRSHSTFCTSSRIRSSTPLISTTLRLISTSLALDPTVLISRPISWATNSSLRPALSGSRISS